MKNNLRNTKNFITLFSILIFGGSGFYTQGQVQVDKPILLTGTGVSAKMNGIRSVTDSLDAVSAQVVQNGSLIYAVATGSGNGFNITVSPPVASYAAGMVFNFISNQTINGPATLNVNNLGAIAIMKDVNYNLAGCEILNGQFVTVAYDGNNFQMISVFASVPTPGVISGADTVCPNAAGLVYSINPVSGATGYNWTVPAGATIAANTGTSITVNFGASPAGNIAVSATNSCPASAPSTLTTLTAPLPTVLSTTAATSITGTTAVSGGDVTSIGGSAVTAYGVCWSTSPNPVLGTGNYTTDGSGTGTFTSNITGLAGTTTYYVSAYATNCTGTAYGPQITFTTPLAIGSPYEGGIIAYFLQPGDAGYNANVQHGLIAATSDQSTGIQWYNGSNVTTNATGTAIGTGASNTALIITAQGSGNCACYAASVCKTYTGGGYTDWYLPSIDEMNELYINQAAIGGFSDSRYWSSTEEDGGVAWYEYFFNGGGQSDANKPNAYYVRAVRELLTMGSANNSIMESVV